MIQQKNRVHFLLLGILLASLQVFAQLQQPARFEKERKFSDEDFTIISLKEDGLALIREKNKYKSGNKTWEVILLDTALQEKQNFDLEIDQRKNLIGYEQVAGSLYLLFKAGENFKLALDLIGINLKDAEISRYEIKTELNLQLTHFIKVESNFVLGGYVNSEPAVLLYNTLTDNTKVLPGFFQKQTELVDLRPNQNQTFNTILVDRSDRDQRKIVFKTFDATGIELLEDAAPIEDRYSLQTSISSTLIQEDMMVLGTWGSKNSKQSNGFYALVIDPFTDQPIKFTAFGELSSYLDQQSPKRAKKIKEKTKDAINEKRIPDFVNYVMPYRIEERPDGFILLAETYIPSTNVNRYPNNYPYGYTPYPYYSPFWGYYPGTYNRLYNPYYGYGPNTRNTDEIKGVQSVLIAFNPKGAVLWDYSLKLDDIRINSLEQITDFHVDGNRVIILYKKESELKGKIITLGENEIKEFDEKIKLTNDADEIRSENRTNGLVRQWYGNNFYVWGQQTLLNKERRGEGNRQVFYINKITFR
ncbi:MAG TPA: hypothetical protein PLV21_16865 [Cyclobacteriaceae bacterium]|nr:hypothetical protein [Cyclobacteriaceae bacterium]HRJ83558.1 hypothetical protein [Cyclobacteriaceae bacterium]